VPPPSDRTFVHTVQAWTVGDLRRALGLLPGPDAVPDHVALVVIPAEEPGGQYAADAQVIFAAGYAKEWVPPNFAAGEREGHWADLRTTFELSLEFPSGTYERT